MKNDHEINEFLFQGIRMEKKLEDISRQLEELMNLVRDKNIGLKFTDILCDCNDGTMWNFLRNPLFYSSLTMQSVDNVHEGVLRTWFDKAASLAAEYWPGFKLDKEKFMMLCDILHDSFLTIFLISMYMPHCFEGKTFEYLQKHRKCVMLM